MSLPTFASGFTSVLARALKGSRPPAAGAVEDSYLTADGKRLHYTLQGDGAPLVLLHGFAVNGDLNWRLPGFIDALANDFLVISLDLRGHGKSDKPHGKAAYGACMAEDVRCLLDHLALARVHLVGYSLGGFIALYLATSHPERLASVTIMGAGWEPPENARFKDALTRLAADLRAGHGINPLCGYLGDDRPRPGFLHRSLVKAITGFFCDQEALAAMVEGLPGLAVSEASLRQLSLPLCAIVGGKDPLRVSAEAMVARVPGAELTVVEGADHIGTMTRRLTLSTLRDFLRRQTRA